MKAIIFLSLMLGSLFAQTFEKNKAIEHFSLPDQFNKMHTISKDIKTLIVSFEKDTGKMLNEFLASKPSDFLQKHHAAFIANISGMPSIITKLFALPKMRDYKHTILLIYDENDTRFIKKEEMSTVYKIENGVIKDILFVKDKQSLDGVF